MKTIRFILGIVLILGGLAPAEYSSGQHAPGLLEKLGTLYKQASAARDQGRYEESIRLFREALKSGPFQGPLHALEAGLHFQIAHSHSLLGQNEEALQALEASLAEGFAEVDELDELAFLKNHPRQQELRSKVEENAQRSKVFDLVAWDNPDLDYPGRHTFKTLAELEPLRKQYRLDDLLIGSKDEWDSQLKALAWVHNRWAHDGIHEPSARNALTILKEVAEGKRFRCVEYSIVLSEVLQALGYPARSIGLRSQNASFGTGKGHVVSEVWNNDLGQWVLLDGQNNSYWEDQGRPLSAQQVRQLIQAGGRPKMVSRPSSWNATPNSKEWDVYFYHLTYRIDHAGEGLALVGAGERYEPLFQGTLDKRQQSSDLRLVYPGMNQVHFDVSANENRDSLILKLSHSMAWFSHYEVQLGSDPAIRVVDPEFVWKLKPGANRLQIRAVNAQGRSGPGSAVEVLYSGQLPQ